MAPACGQIMFENLSDKLQRVFKTLRGEGKLSAENMDAALREIRVALLEADVHLRVTKQFIEAVREKAMGVEVLTVRPIGRPSSPTEVTMTTPVVNDPSTLRSLRGSKVCKEGAGFITTVTLLRSAARLPS